jgi:hypothetical protein
MAVRSRVDAVHRFEFRVLRNWRRVVREQSLNTIAMLPDEILLAALNDKLPGRELQIRTLATLFNVEDVPTRLIYSFAK